MPKNQMLINVVAGEECRIAIIADGKLEELYQERASAESHVGNIYKGRVTNVEPSIQAAFVDFGQARNGFLHISDLHPMYFCGQDKEETEMVGQKTPRRDRPPIQKCLRRGQEVVVQVLKEGIGTKGPTLTSYLSIPGRYLVMMPNMERLGVSRKVEDDDARREMRRILDELDPPNGFGFIIRTAGIGRTKAELKRDLAYLTRLWSSIERRKKKVNVGELFAESDLVVRTIRDVFSSDIEQIIVDEPAAARRARDFLAIASPRSGSQVMLYDDAIPLFHRYDLERQIENINARVVPLPSGGSLVIDSTEALVAIDVNSGKMRDNRDAETTAFKANLEATDEICRQLRLRDLGGVIVNDLIDMRDPGHRRQIEARFRDNLKRDRARTRVLPISQFGILEMTRQRMRPSLRKSIYIDCPHCQGAAQVKSAESVVLDVTRRLALVMQRPGVSKVELTVSPAVAFHILNRKRALLVKLEERHDKSIMVRVNDGGPSDYVALLAFDERGGQVEAESLTNMPPCQLTAVEATRGRQQSPLDDADDLPPEDAPEDNPENNPEDAPEHASEDAGEARSHHARHGAARDDHDDDDHDADETPDQGHETSNGQATAQGEGQGRKRRRRRRRGGRGRSRQEDGASNGQPQGQPDGQAMPRPEAPDAPNALDGAETLEARESADAAQDGPAGHASHDAPAGSTAHPDESNAPRRKRRRRGGRRRGGRGGQSAAIHGESAGSQSDHQDDQDHDHDHGHDHDRLADQPVNQDAAPVEDDGSALALRGHDGRPSADASDDRAAGQAMPASLWPTSADPAASSRSVTADPSSAAPAPAPAPAIVAQAPSGPAVTEHVAATPAKAPADAAPDAAPAANQPGAADPADDADAPPSAAPAKPAKAARPKRATTPRVRRPRATKAAKADAPADTPTSSPSEDAPKAAATVSKGYRNASRAASTAKADPSVPSPAALREKSAGAADDTAGGASGGDSGGGE